MIRAKVVSDGKSCVLQHADRVIKGSNVGIYTRETRALSGYGTLFSFAPVPLHIEDVHVSRRDSLAAFKLIVW